MIHIMLATVFSFIIATANLLHILILICKRIDPSKEIMPNSRFSKCLTAGYLRLREPAVRLLRNLYNTISLLFTIKL